MMRAVLIKDGKGPVENLYLGEAPKPIPRSGEVLVKVSWHLLYTVSAFNLPRRGLPSLDQGVRS